MQLRLVIALRADFYSASARFPWLADRISDNQVLVGPMRTAELRRAIEGPAQRAGLRLEAGLTEAILDEAGDDARGLPLVAHALMETWMRRRGTRADRRRIPRGGWRRRAPSRSPPSTRTNDSTSRPARGAPAVPAARDARATTPGTRRRLSWDEIGDRATPRRRRHAGERAIAHGRRPGRRARARNAHPFLAATARVDRREP